MSGEIARSFELNSAGPDETALCAWDGPQDLHLRQRPCDNQAPPARFEDCFREGLGPTKGIIWGQPDRNDAL